MNEPLPPDLAALLDQLPTPRVAPARKAAVWERIASSAAASTAAAGGAGVAVGAATSKLLLVAALATGVGAGVALDRAVLPQPPPPPPQVIVRVERVEVPVPVEAPQPLPRPPPQVKAPKAAPAAAPDARERQLIEAMRTSLLKRDPAAALQLVSDHRRAFAKGQLAEERDNLEVQALLQDGKLDDARAAAKRFEATYPNSVFTLPEF